MELKDVEARRRLRRQGARRGHVEEEGGARDSFWQAAVDPASKRGFWMISGAGFEG